MRTLALINQKGGCGKTTTAVHLAGALAARGRRPLLVDLDPQAHATLALGIGLEDEPTVADVLVGKVPLERAVVSGPGGISVLPASLALADVEDAAARTLNPERALERRLEAVRSEFDHVIVDCPPRVDGVLAANALRAADTVVLVVETGTFALQGANRALAILTEMASTFDREPELKVVATLFDRRTRLARDLLIAIQARFGPDMFETVIHDSARLRAAAAAGVPIQVLDRRSRAAADFDALADEVLVLDVPAAVVEPAPAVAGPPRLERVVGERSSSRSSPSSSSAPESYRPWTV